MPLSVADFQQIVSLPGMNLDGQVVSISNEQVQLSGRTYKGVGSLSAEEKAQNSAVRNALVEALSQDSKCGAEYRAFLEAELLGKENVKAEEDLDAGQLKSLLDRHVTMQMISKTRDDATGAAIRRAGEKAIDTNHLKFGDEKAVLGKLKTAGGYSDAQVKDFKGYLDGTRALLKEVYSLKGAKAATPEGLETIARAKNALSNLEKMVQSASNRIVRHGGEEEGAAAEATQKVLAELEGMVDFAAARFSELAMIGDSLKTLVAMDSTLGTKRNVGQMAAMLAGKMHTAEDVTGQLEGKMAALDARIAKLGAADAKAETNAAEVAAIRGELAAVRTFIGEVAARGKLTLANGAEMHVEKSFTAGLERHLNQLEGSLIKAEQLSIKGGIETFLNDTFGAGMNHKKMGPTVQWIKQQFADLVANNQKPGSKFADNLLKKVNADALEQYKTLKNAREDKTFPQGLGLGSLVLVCQKVAGMLAKLHEMPKDTLLATNGDLKMMLAGQIGMDTVLGARVYGFDEKAIDLRLTDDHLADEQKLGAGMINAVTLVAYEVDDGAGGTDVVRRVFKPENSAFTGLGKLTGGRTGYNGALNTAAQINRASYQAGAFLGVEHIMPKVTVGTYKNQFGFFMEEAQGHSPADYRMNQHADGSRLENPFPRYLDPAEKVILRGSLMKGTNELMWTDWLTGQIDRHSDNYMVSIEGITAKLKSVDNDASFSGERVGLRAFHLNKTRLASYLKRANCASVEEYNQKHPTHPLKAVEGQAETYAIDAGDDRETIILVGKEFGVNSFAKPMTIGKAMYEKLMSLEKMTPDELRHEAKKILRGGFSSRQLDATVARLQEMIAHVKTFDKETQVLADEDWENQGVQEAAIQRAKANQFESGMFEMDGRKFMDATQDYFLRDFGAMM